MFTVTVSPYQPLTECTSTDPTALDDVLGIWQARQRFGSSFINDTVGLAFASTFQYTVSLPNSELISGQEVFYAQLNGRYVLGAREWAIKQCRALGQVPLGR